MDGRGNSSGGSDSGVFGASLRSLIDEDGAVPLIVDQLVTAIELYGLRQEGLYRKSGKRYAFTCDIPLYFQWSI